ncbi:hypothetical protein NBRC116188_18180 [Oceaniserpentilla sp. 4NH20-0058]|uniref:DedA family protein n=1 Tax=Oceaniserpentilla sp. 4NH20-0058 TaxID=3127660 RepID=UPI0031084A66
MFEDSLSFLNQNPEYLLFSVFLVAMCESLAVVGIIVPGVGLITAISVLAGNVNTPIIWFLLCAISGAFIGDVLSFGFGRYCQPYLTAIWPFSKHPSWITDGEYFFHRHGGKSIFLGRFIGPIRPFIPMIAGMMKMNTQHFLLLNGLSAIAWGLIFTLPSYYLGENLDLKWLFSWQALLILTVMSLIAIAVSLLIKQKKL